METSAKITLESVEGGFAITAIHLSLTGSVPGTDQATFTELANKAKAGCPVSKALTAVPITLDVKLT
jgi:osmotically inducible protein OsmC